MEIIDKQFLDLPVVRIAADGPLYAVQQLQMRTAPREKADAQDAPWADLSDARHLQDAHAAPSLALAIVLEPMAHQWLTVGWSARSLMTTDLALQALLMAVWRRKPDGKVTVHSGQGSQFTSREWQVFLHQHNLEPTMSRRGNCHDNAVAESFFQLLKRERIRRQTYKTRNTARQDVFEYIELFYNPKRKHTNNGMLSPVDFETRQQKLKKAGV